MTQDKILHISLNGGRARALLCESTQLVASAKKTHVLSRTATAALGRMLTATVLLGERIKSEHHTITATIKGSGPIGALVAVCREGGFVKGYVDMPRTEIPPKSEEKLDVSGAVGDKGTLTVVRDYGLREPYVGQVELISGEIAEDFAYYLAVSEQQPALVSLGVLVGITVEAAGGLIIEPFPGCDDALITELEARTRRYCSISHSIKDAQLKDVMHAFFEGLDPVIIAETPVAFACDCSRERMERALITIGESEIEALINDQDHARLECHFCNTRYMFTGDDLRGILQAIKVAKEST